MSPFDLVILLALVCWAISGVMAAQSGMMYRVVDESRHLGPTSGGAMAPVSWMTDDRGPAYV